MKVLVAASEVVGFAKTGGLADVAGALPRALAQRGHACAVILPLFRSVRNGPHLIEPTGIDLKIPVGQSLIAGSLCQSRWPGSNVPVYLVEQPEYFERDDPAKGHGFYQYNSSSGLKRDYADNCARFVFFCRAVLEAVKRLDFRPDILHCNDWQTGLIPVYLHEEYRRQQPFDSIRTVFTIHNLAYQGLFGHMDFPLTGLNWKLFNYRQLEFHGYLNFLKAGIVFADALSTVSPTYAREIQTPYYGCGLQGALLERKDRLFGIVNGVDYDLWNPASDAHLAAQYTPEATTPGKPLCKQALQKRSGLPASARTPVLGVVARLVEQKGIELILGAADALLREDVQLIVLGEGDPVYHRKLLSLMTRFPNQVSVTLGFDESLAHQIEAGVDMFLMPSLYEPSGLNQLYSLKYGTVPIVRETGGLADTVTDCTPETLAAGTATGFSFRAFAADALVMTLRRALAVYRNQPNVWNQLVQTGMRQDWSWHRSAAEYEALFAATLSRP